MIDAVITRLKDQVAGLGGRVEGAAGFTALMQQNALPQSTPAAHVLPLGLQGGAAQSSAGAFTQMFDEALGIVLTVRAHDQTGAKALEKVSQLIREVIAALIGWGPDDEIGVFRLSRGQLVSIRAGALVYQLDFIITDQLRSMT